jgi:hypothetical protein
MNNEKLASIINYIVKANPEIEFIGFALGGSQQTGYAVKGSDYDLAMFTVNFPGDLSNKLTFYDHSNSLMVEIPIFDLTSLKNLELQDLYGYRSETFF